jgi:hypothetical protein
LEREAFKSDYDNLDLSVGTGMHGRSRP